MDDKRAPSIIIRKKPNKSKLNCYDTLKNYYNNNVIYKLLISSIVNYKYQRDSQGLSVVVVSSDELSFSFDSKSSILKYPLCSQKLYIDKRSINLLIMNSYVYMQGSFGSDLFWAKTTN